MDDGLWCGKCSIDSPDELLKVHHNYIEAGADVITANTYASTPISMRNYGYEELYDNNFTLSFNYERLQHLDTEKFSHTDSFFLKLGRIQQEDYEFALSLDALQDYKVRSHYLTKLGEYDLKVGSNYNFISEIPEYGAMIEISKKH